MKNDNAYAINSTHYQLPKLSPALRTSPARSKGFLLHPSFFILRVLYRLLVFLIIMVGLSAYWIPLVDGYKQLVESEASSYLGTQVTIGDIFYDTDSGTPRWKLRNVVLQDNKDAKHKIKIDQLSMSLDITESLRTIRIQPDKIKANGVDVTLTQNKKGALHLEGLPLPIAGFSSGAGRKKPLEITVKEGTLHWLNTEDNKNLDFHNVQFNGEITSTNINATMQAIPPKTVGTPLKLNLALHTEATDKSSDKQWDGKIKLVGEINEPSALPINIQQYTGIIDGDLNFRTNVIIQKNQAKRFMGKLTVDNPILEKAVHDTDDINDLYHQDFQRLSISGDLQIKEDHWKAMFLLAIEQDNNKQISNLSFDYQYDQDRFQLSSKVDKINLDRYLPLLERQRWLSEKISNYLTNLKPRGKLTNFSLMVNADSNNSVATELYGHGVLQNTSIQAYKNIPALQNINAIFNFRNNSGYLDIQTKNSKFNYKKWFEKDIPIKKLSAKINWNKTDKKWEFTMKDLQLENNDAQVNGGGMFVLNENKSPYIDLALEFSTKGKVHDVRYYIPSIIPDGGEKWLKTAIKSGIVPKGGLLLRGDIKQFPFKNSQDGEFLTWFDVTDGTLAYLPNWPVATNISGKVIFKNESMTAEVQSGTILDNHITAGQVNIPSFKHNTKLDITGLQTEGDLSKQVRYIQESPLGKNIKDFLDKSRFTGHSKLEVAIHTPLQKDKLKKENVEVEGRIAIQKASADFSSIDQQFSHISGHAIFDQDGVTAEKIKATYHKAPMDIAISTSHNKRNINITFKQTNSPYNIFSNQLAILKNYIKGKAYYHAELSLPSYSLRHKNPNKKTILSIDTNLKGVKSTLPAPFNKIAQDKKPLKILWQSSLNKKQTGYYLITYSDLIKAIYKNAEQPRVGVVINEKTEPKLPPSGVKVTGSVKKINLLEWKSLLGIDWSSTRQSIPVDIAVQIEKLWLAKQNQGQAKLNIRRNNQSIEGSLATNKLKSQFKKHNKFWNIQLSNLNIDILSSANKNNAQAIRPADFPSINIQCNYCISRGLLFKTLKLNLQNQGDKARINNIEIAGEGYQFLANGNWQTTANGKSYTQLTLKKAEIKELGSFLKEMGNNIAMKQSKTQLSGNLGWQGSPLDFSVNKLSGDIHLSIHKGQLTDVQAGVGKLLGLFNISKLGRRLRFDFSDVSSKGLIFDRIYGDIKLNSGILTTNNTVIESSVMLAGIKGTSNLRNKTHEQVITMIPNVKSTLPTLGLLFGGVGVGAAVATLDKITKKNEVKQLNNEDIYRIRYRVSGAWDNPTITDITYVGAPEDIYD